MIDMTVKITGKTPHDKEWRQVMSAYHATDTVSIPGIFRVNAVEVQPGLVDREAGTATIMLSGVFGKEEPIPGFEPRRIVYAEINTQEELDFHNACVDAGMELGSYAIAAAVRGFSRWRASVPRS